MSHLKLSYILLTNKKNKSDKCPIYLRIAVNRRREISTKRYITENRWDSKKQQVKGTRPNAKSINRYLEQLKRKAYDAETQLLCEQKTITAKKIKEIVQGSAKRQADLIEFFQNSLLKNPRKRNNPSKLVDARLEGSSYISFTCQLILPTLITIVHLLKHVH